MLKRISAFMSTDIENTSNEQAIKKYSNAQFHLFVVFFIGFFEALPTDLFAIEINFMSDELT